MLKNGSVVAAFKAIDAEEIDLVPGQHLEIISTHENTWGFGTNVETMKTGYFPLSCVNFESEEPIKQDSTESLSPSFPSFPWKIAYDSLIFEELVGTGGFGVVYRGKIKVNGCESDYVAMKKFLHDHKLMDRDDHQKSQKVLQKEAEFLGSFSHQNIIQFKGACFDYPHLCIVMEYAENGSLFHYIKKKNPISPRRLIDWALDISRGMTYLSTEAPTPIIHRDLKSQNVLIMGNMTLKISDFGVAKQKPNHSTKMSTAGTFAWMAPESIRVQSYSEFSDVWSFGVILWEMLTGEIPYADIEPYCIAYGVATNRLKLPIPSTCPNDFKTLLEKCWKEDRNQRPCFSEICQILQTINQSTFPTTPYESFVSMQSQWKPEIFANFEEIRVRERILKEKEEELMKAEQNLHNHEENLRKREEELNLKEKLLENKREGSLNSFERHLKSRSLPEKRISSPFNFRHVAHVHWNGSGSLDSFMPESPPTNFLDSGSLTNVNNLSSSGNVYQNDVFEVDWVNIVKQAGVTEDQLRNGEWIKFLIDFTLAHSNLSSIVHEIQSQRPEFEDGYEGVSELVQELEKRLGKKLAIEIDSNQKHLPQKALEEGVDENLRGYPEFLQVGDTICIQWTDYENLLPTLGPNLKCNDLLVVVPCRSKNNKDYIFSYHLFSRRFGIVTSTAKKPGRYEIRIVDKTYKTLIRGNILVIRPKQKVNSTRPRGSTWSSSSASDLFPLLKSS